MIIMIASYYGRGRQIVKTFELAEAIDLNKVKIDRENKEELDQN